MPTRASKKRPRDTSQLAKLIVDISIRGSRLSPHGGGHLCHPRLWEHRGLHRLALLA